MVKLIPGFGCRIIECAKSSFGHSFGGAFDYEIGDSALRDCRIHLIFRLSMNDPLMPIQIKGLGWLPLLFAFQHNGCSMSYRVVTDNRIDIFEIAESRYFADFPYPNYPPVFLRSPVELRPIDYVQQRALCIYEYLQRHLLDPADYLSAKDARRIQATGTELTKLGACHDLLQQHAPNPTCPNPACRQDFSMVSFASLWNQPIRGRDLWLSDGEPIQITYRICLECASIRTFNQCT